MNGFDFDEWADLYRRDPAAFDARRQALLAIELARASTELSAPARSSLRRLEERTAGKPDDERIRLAISSLAESMQELNDCVLRLLSAAAPAIAHTRH